MVRLRTGWTGEEMVNDCGEEQGDEQAPARSQVVIGTGGLSPANGHF